MSRRAGVNDHQHLDLCVSPDGTVNFYPRASDPEKLAAALARIVEVLHENPEAILCACGACRGKHVHEN